MITWIYSHKAAFWWLASLSMIIFAASLIIVPWAVIRIPPDYFTRVKRQRRLLITSNFAVQGILIIVKNICGLILVVAGIIMLLIPGQGLFTIFIGLMLMNFPGKYQLEKWLITKNSVARTVNWLRRRAGREPLIFPDTGQRKD
ncbi:MAG: PGPGW domain-containing protein [Thermodesulfobacteriota bacterium]